MKNISNNHYALENFKERMTSKEWKEILLAEKDSLIFRGEMRQLVAKNLGCGVVEISKEPLKDEEEEQEEFDPGEDE